MTTVWGDKEQSDVRAILHSFTWLQMSGAGKQRSLRSQWGILEKLQIHIDSEKGKIIKEPKAKQTNSIILSTVFI